MNGTSCVGHNRRARIDVENNTYEACFNAWEPCLPDPAANLTFQVDASEVDMAGEAMYVLVPSRDGKEERSK